MYTWTGSGSLLSSAVLISGVLIMVVAGCGGGDGGSGPPPDADQLAVQVAPTASGEGQTGTVGQALEDQLRVLVTRDGEPEQAAAVNWSTPNGGSFTPATSATDANGIGATTWTLGPADGGQTAVATVSGADGSPVTFTATAEDVAPPPPPPPPADATVQVLGPPGDNRFEPASVTIQARQTVAWIWPSGSVQHNVTPDDTEPVTSGPLANGPNEYRYTFGTAGTFDYFCANHGGPGGTGMSGTVIVQP